MSDYKLVSGGGVIVILMTRFVDFCLELVLELFDGPALLLLFSSSIEVVRCLLCNCLSE